MTWTAGSTTAALVAGRGKISARRGATVAPRRVAKMTVAGTRLGTSPSTPTMAPLRASSIVRRGLPDARDDEALIATPVVEVDEATPREDDVDEWFPPFAASAPKLGLAGLGAGLLNTGFELDGPASTIEAIVVLATIIFVHECGHFFAARLQNIHVSKFSVGFGPNLLSYKGPEVEYSLRWVPLGGFVAFPDDDPDCPYPQDDPDLLRNRLRDRAIVISAGVLANVAFGLIQLPGEHRGPCGAGVQPGSRRRSC